LPSLSDHSHTLLLSSSCIRSSCYFQQPSHCFTQESTAAANAQHLALMWRVAFRRTPAVWRLVCVRTMQVLRHRLLHITVGPVPLRLLLLFLVTLVHEIHFAELAFDFIVGREFHSKFVLVLGAIKCMHPAIQPKSGVVQEPACNNTKSSHRRSESKNRACDPGSQDIYSLRWTYGLHCHSMQQCIAQSSIN
jgi:hypothetical protein